MVFALLLGALEGAARSNLSTSVFPLRSVGDYHAQFELKWFALEDYVQKNGGVDVVILGNSMVNTGIDPVIFAARTAQLSGQNLRIFNFGVDGLTVQGVSIVAELIVEHYHPGTIILFTEMRDYIAGNGEDTVRQFIDNPWMRYQMGVPSLEGFLIDRSALLKFILPYRNWSSYNFLDTIRLTLYRHSNITPEGYEAEMKTGFENTEIPDPTNPDEKSKYALGANFSIDPGRVRDLQDIIALQETGVRVIVSEIPVYPTYFIYFGPASVREQYLTDITAIIQQAGGQFVPSVDEVLIPVAGRADDHHMNYLGAPIYSKLLADQLFETCSLQGACKTPVVESNTP